MSKAEILDALLEKIIAADALDHTGSDDAFTRGWDIGYKTCGRHLLELYNRLK